jgi:hypothetical protein
MVGATPWIAGVAMVAGTIGWTKGTGTGAGAGTGAGSADPLATAAVICCKMTGAVGCGVKG